MVWSLPAVVADAAEGGAGTGLRLVWTGDPGFPRMPTRRSGGPKRSRPLVLVFESGAKTRMGKLQSSTRQASRRRLAARPLSCPIGTGRSIVLSSSSRLMSAVASSLCPWCLDSYQFIARYHQVNRYCHIISSIISTAHILASVQQLVNLFAPCKQRSKRLTFHEKPYTHAFRRHSIDCLYA